jgi:hypothetical protein
MRAAAMMMTEDDILTEFGWNGDMIYSLLQNPDSTNARRKKLTGGYTYGLYKRERVLAVAQSKEGLDAKRRWDETLRGNTPNPGWTTRLGDMGRALGIAAVAVGRILELLGYRSNSRAGDPSVGSIGVRGSCYAAPITAGHFPARPNLEIRRWSPAAQSIRTSRVE